MSRVEPALPFTDEEIIAIRRWHRRVKRSRGPWPFRFPRRDACAQGDPWPCRHARFLATLDALRDPEPAR